jgi:ribosomal protein S18 acetylase RimI-like enzyme
VATTLIDAYRQAEDYFFRGISSKCLSLCDAAHAYMTGVPIADLNFVYITKNTHSLHTVIMQAEQFFAHGKLAFLTIIPEAFCTAETEKILHASGYLQTEQAISMVMPLDKPIINSAASFEDTTTIQTTDNQLDEWMLPLIGAFESSFKIASRYAHIHAGALKKKVNFHHFSLYMQEKPIASLTLSVHDAIARIDDVGTLPEFQGKGYATRLMIYALTAAKRLGAHHCFLESSDSGLRIYQKLGFEPLFKSNIYLRKSKSTPLATAP